MLIKSRKSNGKKCFLALALIGALTIAVRVRKARKEQGSIAQDPSEDKGPEPDLAQDPTVYVTDQGKKYHQSNCLRLQSSKLPLKKSEAIKEGYEACGVCKP